MNWTKLDYPEEDTSVWIVNSYGEAAIGLWDGESWKEPDGSSVYDTIVAWAEIDYEAVKQSWNKS